MAFLRIGNRELSLQLIIVVVAGLAVIAAGIAVIVMIASRPTDTENRADASAAPDGPAQVISADDLLVENELVRGTEPEWVPYRPRRDVWSDSDIDEHWIDPAEIGVDVLGTQVEETIRDLLEDVP